MLKTALSHATVAQKMVLSTVIIRGLVNDCGCVHVLVGDTNARHLVPPPLGPIHLVPHDISATRARQADTPGCLVPGTWSHPLISIYMYIYRYIYIYIYIYRYIDILCVFLNYVHLKEIYTIDCHFLLLHTHFLILLPFTLVYEDNFLSQIPRPAR